MIVVDASVLIESLLRRPAALAVNHRIYQPGIELHAPHLIDLEVAHVTRRLTARGEITDYEGERALNHLMQLRLERHSHEPLLTRVWALRHHHSAYDAAFVALAELLEAPLITRDRKMSASPAHRAQIEVI